MYPLSGFWNQWIGMTSSRVWLSALLVSVAAACSQAAVDPEPSNDLPVGGNNDMAGPPSGAGGAAAMPDTGGPLSIDDLETADPESLPDGVPAQSRARRLSYAEFDRSVSELLLTQVTPSDLFPAEQPNLGSYEDGGARGVNERLLQGIVLAAEQLASEAVQDATRYTSIVGCDPAQAGCRDTFIQSFGRRAYRRPLTVEESSRFSTLFDQGPDLVASGDNFRDGVQLVLETVLQSAKFLYIIEQGSGQQDAQGALLSDFEIAARLSYLFWGSGPDDELLDAAAAGTLSTPDGLAAQAQRLANDARVRARVLEFHNRWFQMEGLRAAGKDPSVFPQFNPELVQSMQAEMDVLVEEVTLARSGGIVELLTTQAAAVDTPLAQLYGVSGDYGASPTIVDLPADSGRAGILTRAAFLTGHSSASTRTSPILRGVFVLDRILCETVPPPPPGAAMEEPETQPAEEPNTTRKYFEWKTSMAVCTACHSRINPVGFAFENFDGIGAYRATENDVPVDASGSVSVGGQTLQFQNATDFTASVAGLPRARSCYATNWLKYVYGRKESASDARTLGRITSGLGTGQYGARDVLLTMTTGAAFNHLPPHQD